MGLDHWKAIELLLSLIDFPFAIRERSSLISLCSFEWTNDLNTALQEAVESHIINLGFLISNKCDSI